MDIEQLRVAIGTKLREAREEQGLSQEDVAKQLGITTGAYGAFERAKNLIALNYLIDLSRILSKPVTFFLPSFYVTPEERNNPLLDPRLQYFISMWPLLPDYARDLFVRQIQVMERLNPDLRKAMAERGLEVPEPPEN